MPTGNENYDRARELLSRLTSFTPDIVRKLRQIHGPLRGITQQQLITMANGLDAESAIFLTRQFP